MFDRENYTGPTEVSRETYLTVSDAVRQELSSRKPALAEPSYAMVKMVGSRIRLKSFQHYLAEDKLIFLICSEIDDLGIRIRSHQYIERYRYAFSGLSKEMSVSFIGHIHSLRHNEVYLIKEKSVKLLAFASEVAHYFGISSRSETKNFSSSFDKALSFRLRERHRTTHSHEPPSLSGRAIELFSAFPPEGPTPNDVRVVQAVMSLFTGKAV
jgi:hypothetical protein